MTSLATAKILFFIAVTLGPHDAHRVFVTTNSDNYTWVQGSDGWALRTKGLPSDHWSYRGSQQQVPADSSDYRAILHNDFSAHPLLDLSNGNQVLRQGDAAFYIVDPGAPNEKVYTILYPER